MSSRVKADETAARAKTAPENHVFGSMFGGLQIEDGSERNGVGGLGL